MLPTRLAVWLFVAGLLLPVAGLVYTLAAPAEGFGPFPDPGTARTALLVLLLGYDAGLLALVLVDAWLAGRDARRLRVRRERPVHLSLGVDNDVELVLENRGGRAVRLTVRDLPPPDFPAEPALLSARVPAHGRVRLAYRLLPVERGDFRFGDVYVRLRGPLGLAWADRGLPAAEEVQVYPDLLEVRRYEALVRTTLVRAGGYRPRRQPGGGREFSHYRDYTPDDDYRHVSWKATARRGKPITAVFESEHSQDVIFCLDVGRMMAARVGALTKLDHAINAVLMLAHVSQTFQDNLGLLVFSQDVHLYLPPGKGKAQHAQFLRALYHVQPALTHVNYRGAFQYLIGRHPKRALTMVFTDLLDTVASAEYRDAARLLRRFHLPLTLAVADVPLQQLAARTPGNVEALYDTLVARELLLSRAELLRGLEREGVLVLDTVPERLTVDAVNRYLALKTGMRL